MNNYTLIEYSHDVYPFLIVCDLCSWSQRAWTEESALNYLQRHRDKNDFVTDPKDKQKHFIIQPCTGEMSSFNKELLALNRDYELITKLLGHSYIKRTVKVT